MKEVLLLNEFRPGVDIVRIVLPIFWLALGIPGNCLSIFAWTRPRLRSSSGYYLAAVALFDLGTQLMYLLHFSGRMSGVTIVGAPVMCQLSAVMLTTCQYNHVLLVWAFTLERYLVIRNPLSSKSLNREAYTKRHILVLVVASALVSSVQAYFWYYDSELGCKPRDSVTRNGAKSIFIMWSLVSELLLFGALPVSILVVNIFLIRIIARNDSTQVSTTASSGSGSGHEMRALRAVVSNSDSRSASQTNKHKRSKVKNATLLSVSFFTIVCELPVTILHCLELTILPGSTDLTDSQIRDDITWQRFIDYRAARYVIENVAASHYAVGFYISLATMATFREELRRCMARRPH